MVSDYKTHSWCAWGSMSSPFPLVCEFRIVLGEGWGLRSVCKGPCLCRLEADKAFQAREREETKAGRCRKTVMLRKKSGEGPPGLRRACTLNQWFVRPSL